MSVQKPKVKHHVIPQHYLKGFTVPSDETGIWMYTAQAPPVHTGVKQVAFIRHFYTRFSETGAVIDSESLENKLAEIESSAAPILNRIRDNQWPTQSDRLILGQWLSYLLTRVPEYRSRIERVYPTTLEEMTQDWTTQFDTLIEGSDDSQTRDDLRVKKDVVLSILSSRRDNRPPEFNTAFVSPKYGEILAAMTWTIFQTPGKFKFLTNDNPVFFLKEIGLMGDARSRPWAQVSVPLSADTALWLTWRRHVDGFVKATDHVVREINKRTARGRSRYVFYGERVDWVQRLVDKDYGSVTVKDINLTIRPVGIQHASGTSRKVIRHALTPP